MPIPFSEIVELMLDLVKLLWLIWLLFVFYRKKVCATPNKYFWFCPCLQTYIVILMTPPLLSPTSTFIATDCRQHLTTHPNISLSVQAPTQHSKSSTRNMNINVAMDSSILLSRFEGMCNIRTFVFFLISQVRTHTLVFRFPILFNNFCLWVVGLQIGSGRTKNQWYCFPGFWISGLYALKKIIARQNKKRMIWWLIVLYNYLFVSNDFLSDRFTWDMC